MLQRSAAIWQDESRPPFSAPGAGNAVYHQNGSCGPGRAAIYERKMYLGATKSSIFQAWPRLTLNFFFPPSSFSELKIAALPPEKKKKKEKSCHAIFFFPSCLSDFSAPFSEPNGEWQIWSLRAPEMQSRAISTGPRARKHTRAADKQTSAAAAGRPREDS